MYLIRDGKVEFEGNKKELLKYLKDAYSDEYFIQEYGKILDKDYEKFIYVLDCLGLSISTKQPRRKHGRNKNR